MNLSTLNHDERKEKRQLRRGWIAALRSGEYTQASGVLRRLDDYCCMGVACDVVDPTAWVRSTPSGWGYGSSGTTTMWTLSPDLREAYGVTGMTCDYLGRLNDDKGYTFEQIADVLEVVFANDEVGL